MTCIYGASILLTGGYGFLGSVIAHRLSSLGANVTRFRSCQYDLTHEADVRELFGLGHFDIVIHAAADVGGIGYNKRNPGSVLYNNTMMNILVQEYARANSVGKFVGIGSVCAYPKWTPTPFHESDLWKGYPEETNAGYGLSKRIMLVQSREYRRQYSFDAIHLILANMYGPGDSFDPEDSHVIPAIIRTLVEAKRKGIQSIELWGDGSPTREFLYVEDAADAIILAIQRYDDGEPINIGSGREISIRDLVSLVMNLVGHTVDVKWDGSKPNGQPRRNVDVSRAEQALGFSAAIDLEQGLAKTLDWYLQNKGFPES